MSKLVLLKTQSDFEQFRLSKLYQSQLLRIRIHLSQNQNTPRFGFIIPKKVLPKAVDRNLLKRRIKTFLSTSQSKIKPADVLIFPKVGLLKKPFVDLEQEFKDLFFNGSMNMLL